MASPIEQRFMQSTRLFDGQKKPYRPKRKIGVVVEEKWDQKQHERKLREFYNNNLHWPRGKARQFFTCPYCSTNYNYWSQHEKLCKNKHQN